MAVDDGGAVPMRAAAAPARPRRSHLMLQALETVRAVASFVDWAGGIVNQGALCVSACTKLHCTVPYLRLIKLFINTDTGGVLHRILHVTSCALRLS